jgi:hypothetical protein
MVQLKESSMKTRIVYRFLPFRFWKWIGGMTIYPFILFRKSKEEITDSLFRHELEHIYQVERIGWIKFYVTYLWHNVKAGYRNNPYELQAEERENDPLTVEERALKDNS